jgi:hypothetical protein
MTNQPSLFKKKTPKRKPANRPAPQDRRDLQAEIDTLRLAIDCMSEKIDADGPLNEQLRLMDVISKTATRLAALIKVQSGLGQNSDDYLAGLNRLLAETYEKLSREGVHE